MTKVDAASSSNYTRIVVSITKPPLHRDGRQKQIRFGTLPRPTRQHPGNSAEADSSSDRRLLTTAVHGTTLVGFDEQMTWVEEMIEQNDLTKLAELEEYLFLGVEDHDMELHPSM